ncbi:acyl-CoA dehydrogenase family protein [Candidatus Berkiella aquae]|uniref:3-sulfinopropanoyl-CoA desulfinase n=1 Tax=Candidatus Berkiella aquae TaxID=295108 RepID=A0A0Q9Z1H7_9GAMM|nr:acyl-CoA dehydrogenase family protein [Candidatus Berkiella aquae]MCS5712391.1 acyl-CoA dehydrogenase family protein [Candidatus Berkiella aquae]
MLLTEEYLLVQETARSLADKVIRPHVEEWEKHKIFPRPAIDALAQAGFMGMLVPEQFAGSQSDHLAFVLSIIEIAKASGSVSTIMSVHNSLACAPILKFGTKAQQEQFLMPLARGEKLGAFCLSEPQAGSDAANCQTHASHHGDTFVLNGVKQFVTSGQHADIAIIFARTDKAAKQGGLSAFIVPTNTPGYQVAKLENKMGQHASEIAQIVLEDCRIPAAYMLGNLGEGYKIALGNLEGGRLGIAAQAIGMAEEALRLSMQYAKERKTFDHFLYQHQAIGFKLADMATQLEAAKQLLYHAALLRDANRPCLKEASMAKLFASEVAEKVCREAIQIYGGYGYLQDFPLERLYRDVRVAMIYEGTSEIQRYIISKELIKD